MKMYNLLKNQLDGQTLGFQLVQNLYCLDTEPDNRTKGTISLV